MVSSGKRIKLYSLFIILLTLSIVSGNPNSDSNIDLISEDENLKFLEEVNSSDQSELINQYSSVMKLPSLNYDPVVDLEGQGNNININDELSVYHSESLTIPGSGSDSYTINSILDFSTQELTYNLTIHSNPETIEFETLDNKDDELTITDTMLAHKFTVDWDYAIFHGARMFLKPKSGGYGSDEMKLYIVKEGITGYPNTSLSYGDEIGGPYNVTNPLPFSSSGNFAYYEFGDPILASGTYFIVAEKTADDADDGTGFSWRSQQSSLFASLSYYFDGAWHINGARGMTLIIEMQASDEFGIGVITDPTDISLQDNGQPITSLTQSISSTGLHTLTADTSVDVDINNSYVFERTVVGSSSFQALNSSHLDYSISWDISYSTSEFSISPYSNPTRLQKVILPSNWDKSSPDFLRNGSSFFTIIEESYGFLIDLDQFLSGDTYLNYVITFESTSPNYLFSSTLNDFEFNLGYWDTNGTHAFGYDGSTIDANVFVREDLGVNALDGDLNFTIYDPVGDIVQFKSSNPANIVFSDTSNYTILDTTQESAGRYAVSTKFDPSIYESDKEGYWTVAYFWTNGTEVGFFSESIKVNKPTVAKFILETTHNGGDWNDSITQISRISGDNIRFRVEYLNVSDPFFSGEGNPITAANITFDSDWGVVGSANYIGPYYQGILSINAVEGNYSFSIDSSGTFLESDSSVFEVSVFHKFDINPVPGSIFNAYYTDDDVIQFQVLDTSNASVPVLPDSMYFYIDEVLLTEVQDYSINILGTTIELAIYSGSLGLNLDVGSYDIRISVQKQDFLVSFSQANASTTVNLNILEITTAIEIVSSDDEVHHGNETTITFHFVDTIHSENIMGANFDITFDLDLEDVEIIGTLTETLGLYSVTFRINEPTETSINIFLTINKAGYETKLGITIESISIISPLDNGGIPTFIFIIIGIFSAAAIIIPAVFVVRRKLTKDKREEKALFARIYGIYESVLSITKLIIVHKATGLPVYEMDLGSEITLDPSLITGFLSAISSMGIELRGDKVGGVKRLQYKNFLVTGSESGQFTLYTFSETDLNQEIEDKLTVISVWFAKMFSNITEDWDGSTEVFRINLQGITEKIMKEIHLWIFYPFTVSPNKQAEIEEFTGLRKRLVEYIVNGDNVTISRIFDELDDVRIERGLPIVFELIETGILTPIFDAYKIATVRF